MPRPKTSPFVAVTRRQRLQEAKSRGTDGEVAGEIERQPLLKAEADDDDDDGSEAGAGEADGGSLRMREESEGGVLSPRPPFPPLAASTRSSPARASMAASPGFRGETGEVTNETTLRRQLFRP